MLLVCISLHSDDPRDPLGTCSDCWVFACNVHAELDRANLGKWKCFDGVAQLLSAGAGFDDPLGSLSFGSYCTTTRRAQIA